MRQTGAQSATDGDREITRHVVQGEYAVIAEPNVVLSTILGSCVATCMWDPVAHVGGMNHFLLPGDAETSGDSLKYGLNSMELLINGLLQKGASRASLRAKLFGGAQVTRGLADIGAKNAEFARRFLKVEGVPLVAESLGGFQARRVRFWPATGRAIQLLLSPTDTEVVKVERKVVEAPAADPAAGSVELF
jgi:chemotaxis protein CheD